MYYDTGTKAAGGLLRKRFPILPGSPWHELSHAADHMAIWDLIYGKSYGFSNFKYQTTRPDNGVINEAISFSVDQKIKSKSDMASLAKYRTDMDHPCVRMYTKEEVDANRKFLRASSDCYSMHETSRVGQYNLFRDHSPDIFMQQAGRKEVISIILEYQATGDPVIRPKTFNKFLRSLMLAKEMRERTLAAEKQRDDLKPQWVRDWQDSQGH